MRALFALLALSLTTASFAQDDEKATPPMPDPGDEYPYCIDNEKVTFDSQQGYTAKGWIFHPANDDDCTGFPPGESFPLVLISRGNGFNSYDYEFLASYLAHNGFVVAMVWQEKESSDSGYVAGNLLAFMDLLDQWPHFGLLDGRFALIGHSRGGEGVVRTAQEFNALGWSGDLRTVVDLAGTDGEALDPTPWEIPALLVMTASRDSDVAGRHLNGVEPADGRGTGFALYDRAAGVRAHVHIHGGIHHGFSDKAPAFGTDPGIAIADQRLVTATYVNAWLRWHVLGHPYRDLFTEDYTSAVVDSTGVELSHQFDDPDALVVTRFDGEPNAMFTFGTGGPIDVGTPRLFAYEGDTGAHPYSSPNATEGLTVAWDESGYVEFNLDDPTDASAYDELSFRVGQVYNSSYNTGALLDFTIEVHDRSGGSGAVQLIDWADIAPAEQFIIPANPEGQGPMPGEDRSKSVMRTVRIGLAAFGVDTADLDKVRFEFDGATSGEITIDDVTFTN